MGNHSPSTNHALLTDGGRYVLVGGPKGDWFAPSTSQVMINYRVDDLDGMLEQLAQQHALGAGAARATASRAAGHDELQAIPPDGDLVHEIVYAGVEADDAAADPRLDLVGHLQQGNRRFGDAQARREGGVGIRVDSGHVDVTPY